MAWRMTNAEVARLQRNLIALRHDVGAVDGLFGPKTLAGLIRHVGAGAGASIGAKATLLALDMLAVFPTHGIVTPLRICHFLAQAAHETGGFRWMEEIWGPTAAQRRYEGRADLGNVQKGDGLRFKGRGIFQLTGRANYATFGRRIGVDLVAHPERAAAPAAAVLLACLYWTDRRLNPLADNDNDLAITRKINGGTNGLADRRDRLARAKRAWGIG